MNEPNLDVSVVASVRLWIESMVVGLNLCPFAKREIQQDKIHFQVSHAGTIEHLLTDLLVELHRLRDDTKIETTILIHPYVLQDFMEYNQFLDLADALLMDHDFDGVFQIASFHPQYQFAGTKPSDERNFTNKSPYPILHILRESSLDIAIANHPDTTQIPIRNAKLMQEMGFEELKRLWQSCLE